MSSREPIQDLLDPDRDRPDDEFARQVRRALAHLYDPAYLQNLSLRPLVPLARSTSPSIRSPNLGWALQQSLLQAVDSLRPSPSAPSRASSSHFHELLHQRYVEALEIDSVCDRLGIGRAEYFRDQRRALAALGSILRESWALEAEQEGSLEGQPSLTASAPTLEFRGPPSTRISNLPLQLSSFVGRGAEMAEVRRLLGTTRLLTLTGTGGCGKTRLAYQVAEQLLEERPEEYPDGVWVVELAALADPGLVPQTVAFALDVRDRPGQPLLTTLVTSLRARRLLLVLDNCEHLLDACATLADALLRGCRDLVILATSREALGISGETSYGVPSLSLPDTHQLPPLESLLQFEAVRLFAERARTVQPSFTVTNQNAPAVAQVCWQLDGIPLAIELAAARVRGLTVEQLSARLDDRFRLLTGGSRTALRRQQTLRAAIDWSYDLLSESEKVLFRRLAVFAGGWTLEAAEAICSSVKVEADDVLDLLLHLVDRSLVVAEGQGAEERYRLLETIRQYASEKLSESGEQSAVRDRHLEWCLALAERAEPTLLWGAERRIRLEWLEVEEGNLRAALEWSQTGEQSADRVLHLAAALGRILYWGGRATELRERLGSVLGRPGGSPAARRSTLSLAAFAASWAGDWRKAWEWREAALALAREVSDKRVISSALLFLSWSAFDVGDYVEAHALQEEGLRLAREVGDRQGTAETLNFLTMTLSMIGDDAAARPLAEESLAICRDLGDWDGMSLALRMLSEFALGEGDRVRARALAEAGLAQARESGSIDYTSFCVYALGDVARAEGDLAAAGVLYRDALKTFQQLTTGGDSLRTLPFVLRIAGLWVVQGQTRDAALLYGAVRRWLESVGVPVPWWPPRGYERDEAATREALGEEAFARAWADGQAMTLEQAVEYALGEGQGT